MTQISPLTNIIKGLDIAGKLNWTELKTAFENSDWLDVGEITLEDAATIAVPFVPQAGIALSVVKLIANIAKELPKNNQPFDMNKFMEGLAIAEGLDWKSIKDALMGNNPFLAASTLLEDIAKIASPYINIPSIAIPLLSGLVVIGQEGKPEDFNKDDPWFKNQENLEQTEI